MRPNTDVLFNAVTASASKNSDPIPASQKLAISLQSVSTATINGTLKVQASNELINPSNWVDVANTTLTISTATTQMTAKVEICAAWIRVVFTDSSSGMSNGTITANLQSFGV